jgi:biopolymer transport protein ExbB
MWIWVAVAAAAPPWWNASWSHRVRVRLDNTTRGALDELPVSIRLEDGVNFTHADALGAGEDLRFVADGAELPYEIERWNQAGVSQVWVRVPHLDAGSASNELYVYYGNPGAPAGATGIWTADTVVALHFDQAVDSALPAETVTALGTRAVAGAAGFAQEFANPNDRWELSPETAFDLVGPFTVSVWARIDAWDDPRDAIVTKGDNTFRLQRCGEGAAFLINTAPQAVYEACSAIPLEGTGFRHLVGTYDLGLVRLYVDGVLDVYVPGTLPARTDPRQLWIGNNAEVQTRELSGALDELRIERVARSADWISADHASVMGSLASYCGGPVGDLDQDGVCDDEDVCPGEDDLAGPCGGDTGSPADTDTDTDTDSDADTDTDSDVDTDSDADTDAAQVVRDPGCACGSGGRPGMAGLLLLTALWRRTRSQS